MEDKKEPQKEFVHPDGGYGWVIIVAIILINISVLPIIQCFGIIFKSEFETLGINSAESSFLLHLQSSLFCCLAFVFSPLLKQYSFRIFGLVGAILMSSGILMTSFGNSYGYFIFSVSIMLGVGQSILMPSTYLAINTYFKKRLTLATSLSVTGASMAPIFMPKICDILLTKVGRMHTVLVLFGISLLSIVCCLLLKPLNLIDSKTKMEEVELADKLIKPNSVYNNPTTVPIKKDTILSRLYNIFDLQLLKNSSYICVVIVLGLSFAAELNTVLMMQFLLPELSNFTRSDVALSTTVQSIFDIIGRLVVPLLAHMADVSPKLMYSGTLFTAVIARTILAVFWNSRNVVFFSVSLLGLTKGSRAVFQSVIIPKIVPLDKLPAATGINMLFTGVVSIIIGPVVGAIHDITGSYVYALHSTSIVSLGCVILWITEGFLTRKSTTSIVENT